jgi:hypothetical protein
MRNNVAAALRPETLGETITKLNLRDGGYRLRILEATYEALGAAIHVGKLLEHAGQGSIYGPASGYDGGPTNILGQMEAGVLQGRLRERTFCYRLIIGRVWVALVTMKDEPLWLPYSKQFWLKDGQGKKNRGTIVGPLY